MKLKVLIIVTKFYFIKSIYNSLKYINITLAFDEDLFIAFIDYEKATDRITRNKIYEYLNRLELNGDLIEGIKQTYEKTTSHVKTGVGLNG